MDSSPPENSNLAGCEIGVAAMDGIRLGWAVVVGETLAESNRMWVR